MSNVPKLRFKEFSGEWIEKPFGQYGKLINGLTYSPDNITEDGLLVLRSSNIQNEQISFEDNVYVNLDVEDDYLTRENDILICVRNGSKRLIGKSLLISDSLPKATHGAFMTVFRGKSNRFMSHWLKTPMFYKEVHKNLGATINSINGSNLKKFKTIFPKEQEQEKIASFLTSVDTKIEQLTKKEELLGQYKKGVMQKIFNQKIRFKADDGSEFPEWKEKPLKTIFKERKLSATKSEGYEHISLTTEGVVAKSERYERDFLVSDDSSKKYKVTKLNDICYNPANLKFGVISRNKYGEGIFSPIYVTFEVVEADIKFIEYFVTRWDFINKVRKYEEGTVYERQAVKPEDFLKFSIEMPSIDEQTKIANFLSSIDTKIEQVQNQLEQTKAFKKALLQQMFV